MAEVDKDISNKAKCPSKHVKDASSGEALGSHKQVKLLVCVVLGLGFQRYEVERMVQATLRAWNICRERSGCL